MRQFPHNADIVSLSGSGEILRFIERAKLWVLDNVPMMNNDAQAGRLSLNEMVSLIQPLVTEADQLVQFRLLDPWVARLLMQPLGFPISSLEKHFQEKEQPAGAGLAALVSAEDLLFWLGSMAHHPPRDSHYTNYLWNTFDRPLTYTDDPQEVFFIHTVQRTDELHGQSYQALLPICQGEWDIGSKDALEAILQATKNMQAVRDLYRSFFAKKAEGERNMNLDFFVKFRTFKPPFPIKDTTWTGANAGNIANQLSLDCLIGTVTEEHGAFIDSRLRLLTAEDRAKVVETKKLPSLFDHLLLQLGLSRHELEVWPDSAVACHIAQQIPELQRGVKAYTDLVKASGEMSAIHWSLVKNYVIRAGEKLAEAEKTSLAVSDKAGLTGTSHQQLMQIMNMRRKHPLISKLFVGNEIALNTVPL